MLPILIPLIGLVAEEVAAAAVVGAASGAVGGLIGASFAQSDDED